MAEDQRTTKTLPRWAEQVFKAENTKHRCGEFMDQNGGRSVND